MSITNEKKMSDKKKILQEMKLEWATAHFGVGSRYNVLYSDRQGLGGSVGARSGMPRHGAARLWHSQPTRTTRPSARGMGSGSRYNFCIVTRG